MNEKIFNYYDKLSKKADNPLITRNKAKDFTKYDIEFIKQFADKNKILLDLGSGTGLTINHLIPYFKKIIAIEKYKEFYKFIDKKIEVIESDIKTFDFNIKFDIATLFGVMNYFSYEEAKELYIKIYNSLDSGVLIIKNQFGLKKDVIVDGYSKELNSYYFSEYRFIKKEINLLKSIGFKNIEVIDIYPKEYNRWDNTHFYAIVAKKENNDMD